MIDDNGNYIICLATGKICYTSAESGAIVNNLGHHRYRGKKMIPKRKYYCKFCNCYHLTHFLKKETRKSRRMKGKYES